MRNATIAHEREHEAGYNSCLTNTDAFTGLEAVVGSKSVVSAGIYSHWQDFIPKFVPLGKYASAYQGTDKYWFRFGGGWVLALDGILDHGEGENGCADN